MKVYNDIVQGTPEWIELRKLKFTASNASTILAQGKGLDTLIREMLADYYSSGNYIEYSGKYMNDNMLRGHEYEEKAREIYSLETGNTVEQVGFIQSEKYVGCSPDGLIGKDGLLEIKNPNDKRFIELVVDDKIDKAYLAQMQMQMYVSGRKWCDFFAFNPNFETPYYLKRIYADVEQQQALKEALAAAKKKLILLKRLVDKKMRAK